LLLQPVLLNTLKTGGLDWLNISIYEDNHSKIMDAFAAAREGAFPVGRMALVHHSGNISDYQQAYDFAIQAGAPNLILNHLYINNDPRPDHERDAFADGYDVLCDKINKDQKLRLYAHPPFRSTQSQIPRCGQAMGLISLAPDRTLGPCCHLPPGSAFGSLDDPTPTLKFKHSVFSHSCPAPCKKCYFLNSTVY